MATRNLRKNQNRTQRALDKNERNATKSIRKDYIQALLAVRAILMKAIEKYNTLDTETMSKFNRRDKLIKEITEDAINPLFRNVNRKTRKLVDGQYKQSYFRNSWAVDQNIGVELKWRLKK